MHNYRLFFRFYLFNAIPASMLFCALFDLPYWYYILLRVIIFIASSISIIIAYSFQKKILVILWILIGLLFNPLIPVQLEREIWALINIICGSIFTLSFIVPLILSLPWIKILNIIKIGAIRLFLFVVLLSVILIVIYFVYLNKYKAEPIYQLEQPTSKQKKPILTKADVINMFSNKLNFDSLKYNITELIIVEGSFSGNKYPEALVAIKDITPQYPNVWYQLWLIQHHDKWQPVGIYASGFLLGFDKIDIDNDAKQEVLIHTFNEIPRDSFIEVKDYILEITSNYQSRQLFETKTRIPHYTTGRKIIISSPLFSDIDNDNRIEIINFIDTAEFSYSSFWELRIQNGIKRYKRNAICFETDSVRNIILSSDYPIDSNATFQSICLIADSLNDCGNKEAAFYYYNFMNSKAKSDKDKIKSLGSLAQICYDLKLTVSSQKYCRDFLKICPNSKWAKLLVQKNLKRYIPFEL